MNIRSFLIAGVLTLSAVGVVSAKSYYVTIANPTTAGQTELKPGEYEVKVSGTQAIFTNEAGKTFAVPMTVGQNDKKFDSTTVETKQAENKDHIQEIDLGGTTTKLQFGQ